MEMVGKVQNRPRVPPEMIKSQDFLDNWEDDRISGLQDCLLLEILSRLPSTEDAIRTGTLSKRWKQVWTSVPTLIFEHDPSKHPWSDFVSFIDKTLGQRRQLKLKEFYLYTDAYVRGFESQINNWIRYAVRCNVEELSIRLWNMGSEDEYQLDLDQHFVTRSCFTLLKLGLCTINPNPTVAICWKNLRSLNITYVKLDEDLIENMLFGSPLLETLVLNNCYGFRLLNITSKSVKNLVFSGYLDPDFDFDIGDYIIKINAPNILSLTIEDYFYSVWKVLLLNMSSVVEATIDLSLIGSNMTKRKEAETEMVKGFILNLHNVKEFKIGVRCAGVLSRLKAKGFVFPYIKIPYGWPDVDSVESEYGGSAFD